jgi:hypothetical protein
MCSIITIRHQVIDPQKQRARWCSVPFMIYIPAS